MAKKVSYHRLLGYVDFFPDEAPLTKEEYAVNIGKESLTKLACYFLGYKKTGDDGDNVALMEGWFSDTGLYYEMYSRYAHIKDHELSVILCIEALLNLFIWGNYTVNIPATGNENAESEKAIFKLLLLFNDDVLKNYQIAHDSVQEYDDAYKMNRWVITNSFPQNDLINIDYAQLYYTQIYKAIKLLDFLENEVQTTNLFSSLLNAFAFKSKEELFKHFALVCSLTLKSEQKGWIQIDVPEGQDFKINCTTLEKLCYSKLDDSQDDYLQLRQSPLQKLKDGQYRVVFDLFVLKKVYNGLYFTLLNLTRENKALIKGDFSGFYKQHFSEGYLVYSVLNEIFKDPNIIKHTGEDFKRQAIQTEPDYYARNGNNIFLFESKDFYIKGEIKISYQWKLIESELRKRLYKDDQNGNLKNGAVLQLIKNVERVIGKIKNELIDTNYTTDTLYIYPIIIVHDSLYSTPGLNFWINKWFFDEINTLSKVETYSGFDFSRIKPITIIEIDTLILFQKNLADSQLSLSALIDDYHYTNGNLNYNQTFKEMHESGYLLPFSEFIRNYCHSKNIDFDLEIIISMMKNYNVR